jgi:hypothetical protein
MKGGNQILRAAAAVVVAFSALGFGSTYGQSPALDQKAAFDSLIVSPAYQKFIERNVNEAEVPPLKAQCPILNVVQANLYDIVNQPVFERAGNGANIKSGTWVSVVKVDRCGLSTTRRLLVRYVPDQKRFEVQGLLPGDFGGNLKLEIDAFKIVTPGLMTAGECQDRTQFWVVDVKPLHPKTAGGWAETWIAQACQKFVAATVTYSPISGGMNVAAEEIRALPKWP